MREFQAPPKSSEELKQRKEMKKWADREKKKEERNFEKDKLNLKNNKRLREHQKKEQKSSMKLQAELLRKNAAHGEGMSRRADPREGFYLKDTPLNVCNICSRILDSKNGKERHVKDIPSHGVYQIPCSSKIRCGGLFLNLYDLALHKEITGH